MKVHSGYALTCYWALVREDQVTAALRESVARRQVVMLAFTPTYDPEEFMDLPNRILVAFSSRAKPVDVIACAECDISEIHEDALFFTGLLNSEITCEQLEKNHDCIYGFSSDAFLYFLPGILAATVKENNPNILVVYSLVSMLDRSNTPNTWNDFFVDRWVRLTPEECSAVKDWILWLSDVGYQTLDTIAIGRAFDTISVIELQAGAHPIAKGLKGRI